MQLVLLSGVSGSGKSVALKALEDAGFFCVDNLPADLIAPLVDYATRAASRRSRSAPTRAAARAWAGFRRSWTRSGRAATTCA